MAAQIAEQRLTAAFGAATQPAATTPPQQTLAGTQPVTSEARIDAVIVLKPQDAGLVPAITDQSAPNAAAIEQPATSPAATSPASRP